MLRYQFRLGGINATLEPLRLLPREMRKTALSRALKAGARVITLAIRKALRNNKRYGTLIRSIKSKVKWYRKRSIVTYMIGVRSGYSETHAGRRETPHKYEHFVRPPYGNTDYMNEAFSTGEGAARAAIAASVTGSIEKWTNF